MVIKVLVCGGRSFTDKHYVTKCLDAFAAKYSKYYNPNDNWLPSDIEIITGGALGVDLLATEWATTNWCVIQEYPADWERYGKAAGPIRNKQMLNEGKPDIVIAFPGGRGTANMVFQAEISNIPIVYAEDIIPRGNKNEIK